MIYSRLGGTLSLFICFLGVLFLFFFSYLGSRGQWSGSTRDVILQCLGYVNKRSPLTWQPPWASLACSVVPTSVVLGQTLVLLYHLLLQCRPSQGDNKLTLCLASATLQLTKPHHRQAASSNMTLLGKFQFIQLYRQLIGSASSQAFY